MKLDSFRTILRGAPERERKLDGELKTSPGRTAPRVRPTRPFQYAALSASKSGMLLAKEVTTEMDILGDQFTGYVRFEIDFDEGQKVFGTERTFTAVKTDRERFQEHLQEGGSFMLLLSAKDDPNFERSQAYGIASDFIGRLLTIGRLDVEYSLGALFLYAIPTWLAR